jgi:hypothetical protein
MTSASHPPVPDLATLVALFYGDSAELGQFEQVAIEDVPYPYSTLLAHYAHMTVAMEEFYGSAVDVSVLDTRHDGIHYSRKILLSKQTDGRIVQFGIPRLNLRLLDDEVRQEIESERIPLGRVLIKHNVMREVELVALWRVTMGPDLARMFKQAEGLVTYGRTALIHLNGEPAVELLEIAAPVR